MKITVEKEFRPDQIADLLIQSQMLVAEPDKQEYLEESLMSMEVLFTYFLIDHLRYTDKQFMLIFKILRSFIDSEEFFELPHLQDAMHRFSKLQYNSLDMLNEQVAIEHTLGREN